MTIGKDFESTFVDGSGGGESIVFGGFGDVDREHLYIFLESVWTNRTCANKNVNVTSNLSSSATTVTARSNMDMERFANP